MKRGGRSPQSFRMESSQHGGSGCFGRRSVFERVILSKEFPHLLSRDRKGLPRYFGTFSFPKIPFNGRGRNSEPAFEIPIKIPAD